MSPFSPHWMYFIFGNEIAEFCLSVHNPVVRYLLNLWSSCSGREETLPGRLCLDEYTGSAMLTKMIMNMLVMSWIFCLIQELWTGVTSWSFADYAETERSFADYTETERCITDFFRVHQVVINLCRSPVTVGHRSRVIISFSFFAQELVLKLLWLIYLRVHVAK